MHTQKRRGWLNKILNKVWYNFWLFTNAVICTIRNHQFFFPPAHPSLHFWTTKKRIWRKILCHFILYISYHASLNTDFFFWYVITVPLSHFKIATLFLCGLQIVQFTWVQLPHRCLFKHFIWTVILKLQHTPHLSPMYWAQWLPAARWLPSASWGLCSLRLPGPPGCWISYDPQLLRVSRPLGVLCESDCLWGGAHCGFWDLTDMFSSGSRSFIVFKRNFRYF